MFLQDPVDGQRRDVELVVAGQEIETRLTPHSLTAGSFQLEALGVHPPIEEKAKRLFERFGYASDIAERRSWMERHMMPTVVSHSSQHVGFVKGFLRLAYPSGLPVVVASIGGNWTRARP